MNTHAISNFPCLCLIMLAVVISGGLPPKAHAYEATISAEYQPGSGGEFVFTTPNEGVCKQRPDYCQDGRGSLALPLTVQWRNLPVSSAMRNRLAVRVPSAVRNVKLTHKTNSSQTLSLGFRVAMHYFAVRYQGIAGPAEALWVGLSSPSPCTTTNLSTSPSGFNGTWAHPASDLLCNVPNRVNIPGPLTGEDFSIVYKVDFPNTSTRQAGEYGGKLEFAVGPHGDFDFGDNAQSSLNKITLNFKIVIKPIFNVQFASNTMDVQLAPPGGWSGWIDHGIRPDVLRAEIPFYLTASTPIELHVKCQHVGASTGMDGVCALKRRGAVGNFGKDRAPLRLRLDIPGMKDHRGTPAHNLGGFVFSSTQAHSYWRLYPYSYIQNARSRISIELIPRANSQHADVLAYPGAIFAGTVTLIFEAQLN